MRENTQQGQCSHLQEAWDPDPQGDNTRTTSEHSHCFPLGPALTPCHQRTPAHTQNCSGPGYAGAKARESSFVLPPPSPCPSLRPGPDGPGGRGRKPGSGPGPLLAEGFKSIRSITSTPPQLAASVSPLAKRGRPLWLVPVQIGNACDAALQPLHCATTFPILQREKVRLGTVRAQAAQDVGGHTAGQHHKQHLHR